MTGFRSAHLRHRCAENGEPPPARCLIEGQPDMGWLFDEMFPRGIYPTDVDCMVEVGGAFLFGEIKREGARLRDGQRMALRRLAALPGVTILILRRVGAGWDALILSGGAAARHDWTPAQARAWLADWVASAEAARNGKDPHG